MRLIDADALEPDAEYDDGEYWAYSKTQIDNAPTIEPETYKEKLNEIAGALSEKFAYMNTCLNERDIILGYLGVKLPRETHCNTNCTNTKCESHPSFAQPKPCEDAVHAAYKHGKSKGIKKGLGMLKDAQPETCEGCKHFGKWENEVEYGYPSPCTLCKRRVEDHYESRKSPKNEVFIVDDAYKEVVENLPYISVQPEPYEEDGELDFVQEHKKLPIILETRDKAHWIEVGREEGALGIEYKTLRCSKCGWESSLPIPRNFCPECGRDMRGGDNG